MKADRQQIVKYFTQDGHKVFDVAQALGASGWGICRDDLHNAHNLTLQSRDDPGHIETVKSISYSKSFGMFFVYWMRGGWNCLDHAIEQFELCETTG